MISEKDYGSCLRHIEKQWVKLTFRTPRDSGVAIGLPNPYVSPSAGGIFRGMQFYWDTHFTILGLLESGMAGLARGMVDNLLYLYKRFGIIPLRNRFFNLGTSQIPFLTSMIVEVYRATGDRRWLRRSAKIAEDELKHYWMNGKNAERHLVYRGLSRYCDHFITHITAEHESGWDMTSQFGGRCLDFLPVDLNTCLYKYETDLAEIYHMLGKKHKERSYIEQALKRKKAMLQLMWDEKRGFFFDYDYVSKRRSKFYAIDGFYPLWARMVSKERAQKMRRNLKLFEYKGGLTSTQKTGLSKEFRQWDHPNGWANHQWIVIRGLLNYGFRDDAERIAKKWLDMNKAVFEDTGRFWEKYDVVKCAIGKADRYPTQHGFGWTNAIFVKLVKEFSRK